MSSPQPTPRWRDKIAQFVSMVWGEHRRALLIGGGVLLLFFAIMWLFSQCSREDPGPAAWIDAPRSQLRMPLPESMNVIAVADAANDPAVAAALALATQNLGLTEDEAAQITQDIDAVAVNPMTGDSILIIAPSVVTASAEGKAEDGHDNSSPVKLKAKLVGHDQARLRDLRTEDTGVNATGQTLFQDIGFVRMDQAVAVVVWTSVSPLTIESMRAVWGLEADNNNQWWR